jgi:hypothetical protein
LIILLQIGKSAMRFIYAYKVPNLYDGHYAQLGQKYILTNNNTYNLSSIHLLSHHFRTNDVFITIHIFLQMQRDQTEIHETTA